MWISLDNLGRTDGNVLIICEDQDVKELQQSVGGSNWEAPNDMNIAYAVVTDAPGLVKDLESEGYQLDTSEYWQPEW